MELKEMPSSQDMEMAIIGSILFDPPSIEKAMAWISTEKAFWYDKNKYMWIVLKEMYEQNIPIEILTVTEYIKSKEYVNKIPAVHISNCLTSTTSSVNIEHYAKEIQKKYIQRELVRNTALLHEKGLKNFDENLLIEHEHLIQTLRELKPRKEKNISILLNETINHIKSSDNLIPFGIRKLDVAAGGMTRKEITVIGGRPSHGKSTLVVNLARTLILQGYRVMIFNREMNNIEMLKKLITIEIPGQSYREIRRQELTEEKIQKIIETSELMKDKYKNLIMYDDIRTLSNAIGEVKRHRPDVIIDDYIQKIDTQNTKDRRFQLEDIMNEYSWTIKSTNSAAILVSQLNREIEKRVTDPRPRMSDFAESGAIEQVAENALFVFRGYVFDHERFGIHEFEILKAKVRYGEIGTEKMGFNGNRCRIYSSEEEAILGT